MPGPSVFKKGPFTNREVSSVLGRYPDVLSQDLPFLSLLGD